MTKWISTNYIHYDRKLMFNPKEYMKIKEAIEYLHINRSTFNHWVSRGMIAFVQHPISKYRYFQIEGRKGLKAVKAFLDKMASQNPDAH